MTKMTDGERAEALAQARRRLGLEGADLSIDDLLLALAELDRELTQLWSATVKMRQVLAHLGREEWIYKAIEMRPLSRLEFSAEKNMDGDVEISAFADFSGSIPPRIVGLSIKKSDFPNSFLSSLDYETLPITRRADGTAFEKLE